MANSLDVVAVWIEDIRAVVVGVVDLAYSRCAVIRSAGVDGRRMEGVHLLASVCRQRNVKPTLHGLATGLDPERGPSSLAKSRGLTERLHGQLPSKRREGVLIEGLAAVIVADGESNVINHHRLLRGQARFSI